MQGDIVVRTHVSPHVLVVVAAATLVVRRLVVVIISSARLLRLPAVVGVYAVLLTGRPSVTAVVVLEYLGIVYVVDGTLLAGIAILV